MNLGRLMFRLAAFASVCALGTLAACASRDSYQGISLSADNPDEPLRALARQAATGDKRAQFALGIRFENGNGVPVDLDRAERLYRMAATTSGDERAVYVSSMRPKTEGKVLPNWFQPPQYGIPEAQARLDALRRRRAETPQ